MDWPSMSSRADAAVAGGRGTGMGDTSAALASSGTDTRIADPDAAYAGGTALLVDDVAPSSGGTTGESGGVGVVVEIGNQELEPVPADDGGWVVVLPVDLPPGEHQITVRIGNNVYLLPIHLAQVPAGFQAREQLAARLQEAIDDLTQWVAANPGDAAAAALLAQLVELSSQLASASEADVATLAQALQANELPDAAWPGSCVAAKAQWNKSLKAALRASHLATWLAARHQAEKTGFTRMAVLLAEARAQSFGRRLAAQADTLFARCGVDVEVTAGQDKARQVRSRSSQAVFGSV